MASDGISKPAKTGRCRICQRIRKTYSQVVPVGEIRHGYATGHIWECDDQEACRKVALKKLEGDLNRVIRVRIEHALEVGHFTDYPIYL